MPTLSRLLIDYEDDLLDVIAGMWDVDLPGRNRTEDIELLTAEMTRPEAVEVIWQRLSEDEQQAIFDLQTNEGRIPFARFARTYGDIRPMGPARREREKPWLDPQSITESLYYRGLIARIFLRDPSGSQEYISLAGELAELLPSPTVAIVEPGYTVHPPRVVEGGLPTAPDDMATLIAVLYIRTLKAAEWLSPEPAPLIDRHLRRRDPVYRALLTQLAYDLMLINDASDGTTRVDRDRVRPWLEASRDHQLRYLIDAWVRTSTWNALSITPGIGSTEGWPNDPRLSRLALMRALQNAAPDRWWSIDGLLAFIHENDPDFQRPGGDYTAWYLRDTFTGEILHGFDNWWKVEGQMLRTILEGPMHWLGVVTANRGAFRMTLHGLAVAEQGDWPSRPDPETAISITPHGEIDVSVHQSRYERLQLARFCTWDDTPEPTDYIPGIGGEDTGTYRYRLTPQSIARVAAADIAPEQIESYLQRLAESTLPASLSEMFENYVNRPDEVTIQDRVIVTIKDPVTAERLRRDNRIARLLGREVGPRAYAISRNHLEAFMTLLRVSGLLPTFKNHSADDYP